MIIKELTWRHRNDFKFISYCRHCENEEHWGDGYADVYYQEVVFPNRNCSKCGNNEYGETRGEENVESN